MNIKQKAEELNKFVGKEVMKPSALMPEQECAAEVNEVLKKHGMKIIVKQDIVIIKNENAG